MVTGEQRKEKRKKLEMLRECTKGTQNTADICITREGKITEVGSGNQ